MYVNVYLSITMLVHVYIIIYIFGENTLGECRINILKIERRKRGTTGEKKKASGPGFDSWLGCGGHFSSLQSSLSFFFLFSKY